jgi:hypothetical protein
MLGQPDFLAAEFGEREIGNLERGTAIVYAEPVDVLALFLDGGTSQFSYGRHGRFLWFPMSEKYRVFRR